MFGLLITANAWAGPENAQEPTSSPSGSTGGAWPDGIPANVHQFTPAQIETLRQSCREPNGGLGPAMVVIKPGHFLMGSDDSDPDQQFYETPKHPVTIPRPFAVSRCEITVGQFRRFVAETKHQTSEQLPAKQISESGNEPANQQPATTNQGCRTWSKETQGWDYQAELSWENPGFSQSEQHPVVCVSHDDVTAYVKWLSQRTGGQYRLLTEAEWEYMARAETETPRYFGQQAQCKFANAADQSAKAMNLVWSLADCNDGFTYTAPVAQFQPNAFGLFDVLGNVWEWTDDCWHDNYAKEQTDGSQAWLEADQGDCERRVVRGGSWGNGPDNLRSPSRDWFNSNGASGGLGFRVARAL
jgi:formylglycine-generating enzyme required for sulfatase activity